MNIACACISILSQKFLKKAVGLQKYNWQCAGTELTICTAAHVEGRQAE